MLDTICLYSITLFLFQHCWTLMQEAEKVELEKPKLRSVKKDEVSIIFCPPDKQLPCYTTTVCCIH